MRHMLRQFMLQIDLFTIREWDTKLRFLFMWNLEDQAIVLFECLSTYKRMSILSAYSCFASGTKEAVVWANRAVLWCSGARIVG